MSCVRFMPTVGLMMSLNRVHAADDSAAVSMAVPPADTGAARPNRTLAAALTSLEVTVAVGLGLAASFATRSWYWLYIVCATAWATAWLCADPVLAFSRSM